MKKILILMVMTIIGIGIFYPTVNADETIIDLGTILYSNTHENVLTVEIHSNESVDLQYISSGIDNNSLYIYNYWYSPLESKTTYIFATRQINAEWYFVNDTKHFFYQDTNTKQLYRVCVDYEEIDIPLDPTTDLANKYNMSKLLYIELSKTYNETFIELNNTKHILKDKWNAYNLSEEKRINKTNELVNMTEKYNTTYNTMINLSKNSSFYEMHYNDLKNKYEKLYHEHSNLSGIYIWYIFFAIIGTALAIYTIFKIKQVSKDETGLPIEIERDTGYSQKASKIDKFTAGLLNKIKTKNKQKSEEMISNNTSQNRKEKIEKENKTDTKDIHKLIDEIQKKVNVIESNLEPGKEK